MGACVSFLCWLGQARTFSSVLGVTILMEILTDMKSPASSVLVPGIWSVETAQRRKLPRIQPEGSSGEQICPLQLFEMLGLKWVRFYSVSRKVRVCSKCVRISGREMNSMQELSDSESLDMELSVSCLKLRLIKQRSRTPGLWNCVPSWAFLQELNQQLIYVFFIKELKATSKLCDLRKWLNE